MLRELTPRRLFRLAMDLELDGARALRATAETEAGRMHWAEHANRLHVFSLFQYADLLVPRTPACRLPDLLARLEDVGSYDRVWVSEGVGYSWGDAIDGPIPGFATIPVHSGVGLAIAQRCLASSGGAGSPGLVSQLIDRCAASALPGFEYIAVEAIGLAVRTLHPRLAPTFDAVLANDLILQGCFWHGAGRGAYFATSNWQVAAITPVLHNLRAMTGSAVARTNAFAGFAWAVTLVNLFDPAVLARYVAALEEGDEAAAFADGVRTALIAWQHCSEDDGIRQLLAGPPPADVASARWDAVVRRPAEQALNEFPAVTTSERIGSLFYCEAA
jgi:hypothetical protein